MPLYYGEIKEQLRLKKLLKRLEDGEVLTEEQINFIQERLSEAKNRKLWLGAKFSKNGLQKLQTIVRQDEKKTVESQDSSMEEKTD